MVRPRTKNGSSPAVRVSVESALKLQLVSDQAQRHRHRDRVPQMRPQRGAQPPEHQRDEEPHQELRTEKLVQAELVAPDDHQLQPVKDIENHIGTTSVGKITRNFSVFFMKPRRSSPRRTRTPACGSRTRASRRRSPRGCRCGTPPSSARADQHDQEELDVVEVGVALLGRGPLAARPVTRPLGRDRRARRHRIRRHRVRDGDGRGRSRCGGRMSVMSPMSSSSVTRGAAATGEDPGHLRFQRPAHGPDDGLGAQERPDHEGAADHDDDAGGVCIQSAPHQPVKFSSRVTNPCSR